MPVARPPSPSVTPAPLPDEEAAFIRAIVRQFFGDEAVVRSWGPDPARIALHVETDHDIGMARYDCVGKLMTRIDRLIDIEVTRRGTRVRGNAKLAYRQGIIL